MNLEQVRKALEVAVAAIDGKSRTGQIEMAEAVANSLIDNHHLMVQAGTGTGKSLAYLVPAIVSGKRTLIATATLALQRQLVDRDLPKIVPALEKELNRNISFGIYKGVGNYICLQKLNSDEPDPDTELVLEISSLGKDAQRLRAWAQTPGVSGDRDEAPEVDRRVWAASSVSGRECVGADVCNYGTQCFAANAKAKALASDIVVTNHTLLALEVVESHPILPERDVVILDEAHEFMDRTTQAVTEELTSQRVARAAAMARKYKALTNKLVDAFTHASDNFADAMDAYSELMRGDLEINRKLESLPEELEAPVRRVRETAQAIMQFMQADDETGKFHTPAREAEFGAGRVGNPDLEPLPASLRGTNADRVTHRGHRGLTADLHPDVRFLQGSPEPGQKEQAETEANDVFKEQHGKWGRRNGHGTLGWLQRLSGVRCTILTAKRN